jgi:hypothetical protein
MAKHYTPHLMHLVDVYVNVVDVYELHSYITTGI